MENNEVKEKLDLHEEEYTFTFKKDEKGLDFINSLEEGAKKDQMVMTVRYAAQISQPKISYKDVLMLDISDFMEFLADFTAQSKLSGKIAFLGKK